MLRTQAVSVNAVIAGVKQIGASLFNLAERRRRFTRFIEEDTFAQPCDHRTGSAEICRSES
jgi:hypothetical protein